MYLPPECRLCVGFYEMLETPNGRIRLANLWVSSKEAGKLPSERVCKDRDENYRFSFDEICFAAYCQEIKKKRKK